MTCLDEGALEAVAFAAPTMGSGAGRPLPSVLCLKAVPIILPRSATVLEGFRQVADSCTKQFLDNRTAFFRKRAPEHLHQMRVAIRRLRSLLSFHKRLLDATAENRLRRRLKHIFGILGRAREFDVLMEQVRQQTIGPIDRSGMQQLRTSRSKAYATAEKLLRSPRLERLLAAFRRWLGERPLDPVEAASPLKSYARHVLRRQFRGLRRFDDLARLPVDDMHQLRIRAKKLRYACDFFQSSFVRSPKAAKPLVKPLERLQDALGAFNDMETLSAMAAAFGAHTPSTSAPPDAGKRGRKLRLRSEKALHTVLDAERFWKTA